MFHRHPDMQSILFKNAFAHGVYFVNRFQNCCSIRLIIQKTTTSPQTINYKCVPEHDKTIKMACTPSKDSDQTQSDQSLRCPHEETLGPKLSVEGTANDSDQTARRRMLSLVFAGRRSFVGFVVVRFICNPHWSRSVNNNIFYFFQTQKRLSKQASKSLYIFSTAIYEVLKMLGTMAHRSIIDRSSYYSWFGLSKSVGNSSFSLELF